ncbi:hypothetical protein ACMYSQ_003521 [Aspergillus niger]
MFAFLEVTRTTYRIYPIPVGGVKAASSMEGITGCLGGPMMVIDAIPSRFE